MSMECMYRWTDLGSRSLALFQTAISVRTSCHMPHISQNKNVVQKPVEFKEQWLVKFGLEVSTRDFGTSKVTSVLCLFCKQWERDDGETDADGGMRKRKGTIQYFSSPWRSENFTNHLGKQHKVKWEVCQGHFVQHLCALVGCRWVRCSNG
jgi:hypothetical protein